MFDVFNWETPKKQRNTVDGQNPAPVDMVNIPKFYRASYIPGGAGFPPSTALFRNPWDLQTIVAWRCWLESLDLSKSDSFDFQCYVLNFHVGTKGKKFETS